MHHSKYPSTPYLPTTQSYDSNDLMMLNGVDAETVVITEKMDGEGTTFYNDGFHARSLDSRFHPSRSWVAALHGSIAHLIPDDMKICGENLYAEHSIRYENLPSYFMVYNIWQGDTCLSWNDTVDWCDLLGLETVPVLYHGPNIVTAWQLHETKYGQMEGYVVREAETFHISDWNRKIGKWVRPHHVQTDEHWMHKEVVPNGLRKLEDD